jgi:hypothetical protein
MGRKGTGRGILSGLGIFSGLGARKADRENLRVLEGLYLRAAPDEEIISAFRLDPGDLGFLRALSLRTDGWYPARGIMPEKDPSGEARRARALARAGLVLSRPLKGLVRLSDSGRYVLIMLAERLEAGPGGEGGRDAQSA